MNRGRSGRHGRVSDGRPAEARPHGLAGGPTDATTRRSPSSQAPIVRTTMEAASGAVVYGDAVSVGGSSPGGIMSAIASRTVLAPAGVGPSAVSRDRCATYRRVSSGTGGGAVHARGVGPPTRPSTVTRTNRSLRCSPGTACRCGGLGRVAAVVEGEDLPLLDLDVIRIARWGHVALPGVDPLHHEVPGRWRDGSPGASRPGSP